MDQLNPPGSPPPKPISLFRQILTRPPAIFPWIALFHLSIFIYYLIQYLSLSPGWVWLQPLWLLAFTIFWVAACTLRKWGVYGYLFLVALNIGLRFLLTDPHLISLCLDALFPVDILFSFLLLFHFRRFN